eukprot:5442189-Amphidinium_carterae.1
MVSDAVLEEDQVTKAFSQRFILVVCCTKAGCQLGQPCYNSSHTRRLDQQLEEDAGLVDCVLLQMKVLAVCNWFCDGP